MADITTLKRDGGWLVKLVTPVKLATNEITEVLLRKPRTDHYLHWVQGDIASVMSSISTLSGVSERLLQQLTVDDLDRVMVAWMAIVPPAMRTAFQEGRLPISLHLDEIPMSAGDQPVDQTDPRFPQVDGEIKRFTKPPAVNIPGREPKPPTESDSLMSSPEVMKAVG